MLRNVKLFVASVIAALVVALTPSLASAGAPSLCNVSTDRNCWAFTSDGVFWRNSSNGYTRATVTQLRNIAPYLPTCWVRGGFGQPRCFAKFASDGRGMIAIYGGTPAQAYVSLDDGHVER